MLREESGKERKESGEKNNVGIGGRGEALKEWKG